MPPGPPPTVLESSDLITGTGATATSGATITVQYVLVSYATGKVIQSSWDSMPFSFPLGQGQVIPGWDEGVVGMKVGGRRELIIPPALAYQSQAQQGIPANSTLIFIIDLLKVG
ncbi:MAG TPA: FKBP-type peptidyl-prolyl cis-trans isomerase [Acidimicrobiales bacterium]